MRWFYSAAQKGFYNDDLHTSLPSDAQEISASDHAFLMAEQAKGKEIVANEHGFPISRDREFNHTPEQKAHFRLVQGCAVEFENKPELNGVYPLIGDKFHHFAILALDIFSGLSSPNQAAIVHLEDGAKTLTSEEAVRLYKLLRSYRVAVLAGGTPPQPVIVR